MHGSRSKIPSEKSCPFIHVKFLALLAAPYIYDISRLRVKLVNLVGGVIVQHNIALKEEEEGGGEKKKKIARLFFPCVVENNFSTLRYLYNNFALNILTCFNATRIIIV
jgi:hypothetical protein